MAPGEGLGAQVFEAAITVVVSKYDNEKDFLPENRPSTYELENSVMGVSHRASLVNSSLCLAQSKQATTRALGQQLLAYSFTKPSMMKMENAKASFGR